MVIELGWRDESSEAQLLMNGAVLALQAPPLPFSEQVAYKGS
jgi:hypothetical protein